jgi:hypothetical protein
MVMLSMCGLDRGGLKISDLDIVIPPSLRNAKVGELVDDS